MQTQRNHEIKRLTGEEYQARLDLGQEFRDAALYEHYHARPDTEFFLVDLTEGNLTLFKRRIK